MKISTAFALVLRVGGEPPGHLIPPNHVTVRGGVPSWIKTIVNCWPVVGLDRASVLFPDPLPVPSVTECQLVTDRSNVMVEPGVSPVMTPIC